MQQPHDGVRARDGITKDLAPTALLSLAFVSQLCYAPLSAQFINSGTARKSHAGA